MRLTVCKPYSVGPVGLVGTQTSSRLQLVQEGDASSIISPRDFTIHPHMKLQVAELSGKIGDTERVSECEIVVGMAAHNLVLSEQRIVVPAIEIARTLGRDVEAS